MNESTFKEFYNRTYRPLRSYICRICKNPSEADDIVQESYLRILQRPLETNDQAEMKTTIYTIATRINIDRWKRKKTIEKWRMSNGKNEAFTIENSNGLSTDMMQVFEKLNSKERSLLWLAYVDGHNLTLAELQIDDIQGLTSEEKQAKVIDLLTARSGVYHPSAYSTRSMEKTLPARGSHPPGTFWFYQNWDFNTLATIFKQETGQGVFKAFAEHLANPLQLEDFGMEHTFYLQRSQEIPAPGVSI